jgi:hypothetical protein
LPEYCDGFGIAFDGLNDFFEGLDRMASEYLEHLARMPTYPHTSDRMVAQWLANLNWLHDQRAELLADRRLFRSPVRALATQLPF